MSAGRRSPESGTCPSPAAPIGGGAPRLATGCPTADETAGKVYQQLNSSSPTLLDAPNPQSSAPYGQEGVGWVYQSNSNSNQFMYTSPVIYNLPSTGIIAVGSAPIISGYTYEGIYHTHGFDPTDPQMIDSTANNHFSLNDETYSSQPIYVAVEDTLSGDNNPSDATGRWYKYDPSTGKETLMNTVGNGGC
jgi:hypothetical protein